jgi:hypothetical protein
VSNFRIILMHAFPCQTKEELEAEEYRVLDMVIASGTVVYNSVIGGDFSTPVLGELHGKFNHGGVIHEGGLKERWFFKWHADGAAKKKSFAVRKYGFWNAKALAEAHRRIIFPKWVKDPEETILDELYAIDMD